MPVKMKNPLTAFQCQCAKTVCACEMRKGQTASVETIEELNPKGRMFGFVATHSVKYPLDLADRHFATF